MPPAATNNKRKRTSTNQTKKSNNTGVKRTSGRNLDSKYQLSVPHRGHAKEYGDPTVYPCGAVAFVDSHISDCPKCDSFRFLMDTWTVECRKRQIEEPPPISYGCAIKVLRKMGASLEDVRDQDDNWTPFEKIKYTDLQIAQESLTELSFVDQYNSLTEFEKNQGLRPTLPLCSGYTLDEKKAAAVPTQHRKHNTHTEAMEYLLMTALLDGVIPQAYVNATLANFGILPAPANGGAGDAGAGEGTIYSRLRTASGVELGEVFNFFQHAPNREAGQADNNEVDLADFKSSPRTILNTTLQKAGRGDQVVAIPNLRNARLVIVRQEGAGGGAQG